MKLAYREAGSGRPLIILHGLFGQSDNWNTLAKAFAAKGFRVFTPDQRNHGLSPQSETWDYPAMADDLKEFIDEHQLVRPVLIGHSMGAKTVLFFESKYPGVSSKLVIADMAAREYPAHHTEVLHALHAVDLDAVASRKEAEAIMEAHIPDAGTRQFLLKNIYWKEDGGNKKMDWRFNLQVITDNYDHVRVAVPTFSSEVDTLVINGERSDYVTSADVEDFKARFRNVTFHTIAGAGHWVHAEKPAEFLDVVAAFISG